MSNLLKCRLLSAIVITTILIPLVSFSQVTIKEKVEIQPKASANVEPKSERELLTAIASDRFYHPPLFVVDQVSGKAGLPLGSTLTVGGSITIGGLMDYGQQVILLDVGPFNQEHPIAWKVRSLPASGGEIDEGESPYTGTFAQGPYPDVRLYLFDYEWWDGTRTFVYSGDALTYNFTGSLFQGWFDPRMPVTATATATGSQLPSSLFDRWRILAQDMVVSGSASRLVDIRPLNAGGGVHVPWGIPRPEAEMTVRVDTVGPYVFLRWNQLSGQEITLPLGYGLPGQYYWTQPRLWYDPSKGTFAGPSTTIYVSVTGGGITTTVPVKLTKVTTCARVTFGKAILDPGETTTLAITKEDGSSFGSTDAFDVEIMAGAGTLHSSGGSGTSLTNARPPVTYTAPESIEGDSLVVKVAAYGYYSGEGGASASLAPPVVAPSPRKVTGGLPIQSVSPQSDRAALERIGKLLASNACSAGQAVVKDNKRIPTSIALAVDPKEVVITGQAVLKATLGDVNGKIEPSQTDAKIDFKAGQQANGYAVFKSNGGTQGLTLNGVEYTLASNGSVTLELDGTGYVGRFALGIDVSARTSTVAESATRAVYLRGPNTTGKRILQTDGNWDTLTYDKSAKKIGDKGCALTCIAMALSGFGVDVDPARLNTWMNDSNGYATTHDVKWSTIRQYPGSRVKDEIPEGGGMTYDEITKSWWSFNPLPSMTRMDNALTAGSVAIAQVWNPSTKNAHWVLVTGKTTAGDYTILDPGGYDRVTLSTSYETIYRYVPIRVN